MKRMNSFWLATLALSLWVTASIASEPLVTERKILVAVADGASPAIRAAADRLVERADAIPPFKALMATQGPHGGVELVDAGVYTEPGHHTNARNPRFTELAYNHLVLVGVWQSDPLLEQAKGWTVTMDPMTRRLYTEGYGEFEGSLGWVASGPNPWLHSQAIDNSPYETLLFVVTGTDEKGVLAACAAFESGLLNGLVPTDDFWRRRATVLDLDPTLEPCQLPLPDEFALPADYAPGPDGEGGKAIYMGWTQASATEYRAYIDVGAGRHEPTGVWRIKWLGEGVFNRMNQDCWWMGPHRMASGNALVLARFASPEEAAAVAAGMSSFSGWNAWEEKGLSGWSGPPTRNLGEKNDRPLYAAARGEWLVLSGLPGPVTAEWAMKSIRP